MLMGLLGGYYYFTAKQPMKEVTFHEFLNDYLLTRRVKKIDIVKD